jgi:hypothetical protein
MKGIKYTWFSLGLVCVSWTSVFAQNTAVGTGAPSANEVFLKATGPYEDMVHYILARNDPKVAKSLAAADAHAGDVVKILPAAAAREFESLRQKIHKGIESKDGKTAAGSSVAVFRMLVDRLDASTLVVPKEVELLDYAGYQLSLLASFEKPDWKAIRKLADDSDTWWKATADKVSDKHLRATTTSAIVGIKQAAEQKNRAMLQLGAQMVLDLVDMLEDSFKAAKVKPAVK